MPIYMKYEGIDGDVTAAGKEGWIEISSCQMGVGRGIPAPTIGAGKDRESANPNVSEIVVTKVMDNASTNLFQESLKGKSKTCDIHFCEGTETRAYLELTLTESLISSYSVSSGGDRPMESLSLNFTEIEWKYFATTEAHDTGDTPKVKFNLKTNEFA